jgi:GT2 family glycosyltransferase
MTNPRTGYSLPRETSASEAPLIDVVIVTARGSWELLHDCLRSLREHPAASGPISIHVVDNDSGDGTIEAIRRHHPEVDLEALADNRGFAHGCNRAIRRSSAPFVLVLNPDTMVHQGAIDALAESLDRHPRAAIAGPRLLDLDGRTDHNAKRRFPTAGAALAHFVRLPRRSSSGGSGYGRSDIADDASGVVDAVSGSCMLVRRAAIEDVGLMDEGYWMYGEDLDWCRRFGQHGWEVRYEGAATILHVKHGVTGQHRSLRINWAFHRAMGRFYRRFDAGANPALDTAVYAGILVKFGIAAARSAIARRGRTNPVVNGSPIGLTRYKSA